MRNYGSRHRPTSWLAGVAALGLASTAMVLGGAAQAAPSAKSLSVVNYAQCANGTGSATSCTGGWINGILQSSNSHFRESDVTPQRLQISAATDTVHTVTLTYQTRKGGSSDGTHAYDGLSTYTDTVSGARADRCLGLTAQMKQGLGCPSASDADGDDPHSSLDIPRDVTEVGPAAAGVSKVTGDHVPGQRSGDTPEKFIMYGGTLMNVVDQNGQPYSHSDPMGSGDDYATITIRFTATAANTQLLFGGHLAVSPTTRSGWGTGLGASNINGGPYHIKWAAADGVSVGNRDNQIMGSSIGELFTGLMTTAPNPTSYTTATVPSPATVSDEVRIVGLGVAAGGTVTFRLYGPWTAASDIPTGTAAACTTVGKTVLTSSAVPLTFDTADSRYEAIGSVTAPTAPGWYQWIASYSGDGNNQALVGGCGETNERLQVSQATAAATSTQSVTDRVEVTGVTGGATPTGSVTFELWSSSTCTDPEGTDPEDTALVFDSTNDLAAGVAVSDASPYLASGTYYWKATYNGDSAYASGVVEACGVQRAVISNTAS